MGGVAGCQDREGSAVPAEARFIEGKWALSPPGHRPIRMCGPVSDRGTVRKYSRLRLRRGYAHSRRQAFVRKCPGAPAIAVVGCLIPSSSGWEAPEGSPPMRGCSSALSYPA
jgi:hypothetical protein